MARYGQINIGRQTNYMKFESVAARREFAKAFEEYHASHEHDGEAPTFAEISASELSTYEHADAREWGDKYVTIDGYKAREIYEYHTWDGWGHRPRYEPPPCRISPLIVLEKENLGGDGRFVDSGTLERHALSSIFGDMPEADFASLLESVKSDGFFDPLIRMYEGKVLDGWHRYRAALSLNIVRKLKFTTWNEEDEGDPVAFVSARNIERRHLNASQRAQIVVSVHERFGHGGDRSKSPNGDLKSRESLAKQANVGTSTIDRAVQVEKSGQSEAVISGEKSASAIITEITVQQLSKQVAVELKAWKQRHVGVNYANQDVLVEAYREQIESSRTGDATAEELKCVLKEMRNDADYYALRVRYLDSDLRFDFEAAARDYFKARSDLMTKVEAKEISLSEVIEGVARHYHRTDIASMFQSRDDIGKDETITVETFGYWANFMRVLAVDVSASAPWIPKSRSDVSEAGVAVESDAESRLLQRCQDTQKEMWAALETVAPDWNKEDFMQAACDKHSWGVSVFPVGTHQPGIWVGRYEMLMREIKEPADWIQQMLDRMAEPSQPAIPEVEAGVDFDNFCDTIEALDQAWEAADLPISFEDEFLLAAADRVNFFPAVIKELYKAGKARQRHEEYEDYRSWNKTFKIILKGLQERSHWVEKAVAKSDKAGKYPKDVDSEVKSEFYNAFKALQLNNAEQLERYKLLPVGRTPLIYAEAIKTYYEFQSPRIRPDTEPTVEHYKGATVLMQERPVEFIAQFEGRHYRRIIAEWDDCVMPDLVKRYAEYYGASEITSENLQAKIRQAIRDAYDFKGRITTQPFDVLFEITEDAHTVLVYLDPDDWSRDGNTILWAHALHSEFMKGTVDIEEPQTTQDEHQQRAKGAIAKLKEGLKKFHVLDIEEFTDDILQFFEGVIQSELSTSSPETLKGISEFIEGFVEQPLQAWPEYIRNSDHIPKRELVLVSIGISNQTSDEFEMVEFTDESSDEIGVALSELPAEIHEALFKIAVEKIYASHVRELED